MLCPSHFSNIRRLYRGLLLLANVIPVGQAIAPMNCTYPGTASVQAISSSGVHNKHYMQTISFPASQQCLFGWSTGKKGEKSSCWVHHVRDRPRQRAAWWQYVEQKLGLAKSQLSRDLPRLLPPYFATFHAPETRRKMRPATALRADLCKMNDMVDGRACHPEEEINQ